MRFIFILLGPSPEAAAEKVHPVDYTEIGRSISTLMANTDFHEVAYQAEEKEELLQGIDNFLHDSVVLPPGAWDSKLLKKLDKMDNPVRRRKQLLKEQQDQLERHEQDAHLQRKGAAFHGVIDDVKKRYRNYPSDFKDAFNFQV